MVLRALIAVALLAATPAQQLGRSYDGRPIQVVHVRGGGSRVLVFAVSTATNARGSR